MSSQAAADAAGSDAATAFEHPGEHLPHPLPSPARFSLLDLLAVMAKKQQQHLCFNRCRAWRPASLMRSLCVALVLERKAL